jgi:hypothetical protein
MYCTEFAQKWTNNVENTGKSQFMSPPKALISPRRFSGNSKCPTVFAWRSSIPFFSQIGQETWKVGGRNSLMTSKENDDSLHQFPPPQKKNF